MALTLTDLCLPERIRARIDTDGPIPKEPHTPVNGQCWLFQGYHIALGYPYTSLNGKDSPAHRVIFHLATGQDVAGFDVDHRCRNVGCVNPNHMEAVTHAENQARIAKAQNKCRKSGHDWTDPNNVRVRPNGRRYCKQCYRQGTGGHPKKYSNEVIHAIRFRVRSGESQASVARELSISPGLVSRIVSDKYRAGI